MSRSMAFLKGSITPEPTENMANNQDQHGLSASQGILITSSPPGIEPLSDNITDSEHNSGPSHSGFDSSDSSNDAPVDLRSHDEKHGTRDRKRRRSEIQNTPEFILEKVTQADLERLRVKSLFTPRIEATINALTLCVSIAARQGEHLRYWPERTDSFRYQFPFIKDANLVTILYVPGNSRWIAVEASKGSKQATVYDSLTSASVMDKEVREEVKSFCNSNFKWGKWVIEEGRCAKHPAHATSGIYPVVNALHIILNLPPPLDMNVAIWHKLFSALIDQETMASKLDQVSLEFVSIPIPACDVTGMSAHVRQLRTLAVQTYRLRASEAQEVVEMLSSHLRNPVECWITELQREEQENWYGMRIMELELELKGLNTAYTSLESLLLNSRFENDSDEAILKSLEDGQTWRMELLESCRERQVVLEGIRPRVQALDIVGAISMAKNASAKYLEEAEKLISLKSEDSTQ